MSGFLVWTLRQRLVTLLWSLDSWNSFLLHIEPTSCVHSWIDESPSVQFKLMWRILNQLTWGGGSFINICKCLCTFLQMFITGNNSRAQCAALRSLSILLTGSYCTPQSSDTVWSNQMTENLVRSDDRVWSNHVTLWHLHLHKTITPYGRRVQCRLYNIPGRHDEVRETQERL